MVIIAGGWTALDASPKELSSICIAYHAFGEGEGSILFSDNNFTLGSSRLLGGLGSLIRDYTILTDFSSAISSF